jgi:arabinofuranosyltransferase
LPAHRSAPASAHRSELASGRWAGSLKLLVGILAGGLLAAALASAWVCDDAWFSLRSAWNLAHGHGLVFNPGERVQAFTSPLWTLLLAVPLVLQVPAFPAALLLSGLCTVLTVALLARRIGTPGAAALALALLLGSKAFVDYCSSGLENPLIHLLYLAFLVRWRAGSARHPGVVGLLAGLLMLTRLDLALLVLPHLLLLLQGTDGRTRLRGLLPGALLLLLWGGFSLLYYGSPVPTTAIAKLGDAGLPRGFLLERGLAYLTEGLAWDPLTLPVIAAGLVLALAGPWRSTLPTAAGVLLYLIWVVWMGGDFMAGRFLAAPLLGAVFILAQRPLLERPGWLLVLLVVPAMVLLLSPRSPLRAATYDGFDPDTPRYTTHQIADERLVYHERGALLPGISRTMDGGDAVDGPHELIVFEEVAGFNAFIAGPSCHVVNPYGLSDAFVARMPATPPGQERAGHVLRRVPPRYLDSIHAGENLLEDPQERALLDDVWLLTRRPILAPGRLGAMVRLHRPR